MRKLAVILPSLEEKGPFIVARNIIFPLLESKKYEIVIFTLRGEDCFYQGVEVISLKMNKLPSFYTILKLRVLIKKEKIDLLHAHTFWPTILASFISVNKVVTVHNNPYEDYPYEYGKFLGGLMASLFTSRAKLFDKVVSISNFVQSSISNNNRKNNVVKYCTIYNGVDIDAMADIKEKCLSNGLSLIIVAALIPRKNIFESIELINILKINGYRPVLKVVGEGPLLNSLKSRVIQLGLTEEVLFLGSKPYNCTISLIRDADIFLFTSKSEGFGLVLVEAMLNGTVILAKRIPATEEVLKDERLIFSNYDEFILKIDNIIKNYSSLQKMSLQRAKANFSFNLMAERYSDIYDNILER